MKALFLILFVAISSLAFGQVQITNNPYNPQEDGAVTVDTNVTLYKLPGNAPYSATVVIKFPSGNASTVKVSSTSSSAITASPDFVAGETLIFEVKGGRFWIKFENASDDIQISW